MSSILYYTNTLNLDILNLYPTYQEYHIIISNYSLIDNISSIRKMVYGCGKIQFAVESSEELDYDLENKKIIFHQIKKDNIDMTHFDLVYGGMILTINEC